MFGDNIEGPPCLELVVTVYNINEGYNEELAGRSPLLRGYREFVCRMRDFLAAGKTTKEAMLLAAKRCIRHNMLVSFLEGNITEVDNMLLTEWDEEMALAVRGREAREDGLEEGLIRGRQEGRREGERNIIELLKAGKSPEDILRDYRL